MKNFAKLKTIPPTPIAMIKTHGDNSSRARRISGAFSLNSPGLAGFNIASLGVVGGLLGSEYFVPSIAPLAIAFGALAVKTKYDNSQTQLRESWQREVRKEIGLPVDIYKRRSTGSEEKARRFSIPREKTIIRLYDLPKTSFAAGLKKVALFAHANNLDAVEIYLRNLRGTDIDPTSFGDMPLDLDGAVPGPYETFTLEPAKKTPTHQANETVEPNDGLDDTKKVGTKININTVLRMTPQKAAELAKKLESGQDLSSIGSLILASGDEFLAKKYTEYQTSGDKAALALSLKNYLNQHLSADIDAEKMLILLPDGFSKQGVKTVARATVDDNLVNISRSFENPNLANARTTSLTPEQMSLWRFYSAADEAELILRAKEIAETVTQNAASDQTAFKTDFNLPKREINLANTATFALKKWRAGQSTIDTTNKNLLIAAAYITLNNALEESFRENLNAERSRTILSRIANGEGNKSVAKARALLAGAMALMIAVGSYELSKIGSSETLTEFILGKDIYAKLQDIFDHIPNLTDLGSTNDSGSAKENVDKVDSLAMGGGVGDVKTDQGVQSLWSIKRLHADTPNPSYWISETYDSMSFSKGEGFSNHTDDNLATPMADVDEEVYRKTFGEEYNDKIKTREISQADFNELIKTADFALANDVLTDAKSDTSLPFPPGYKIIAIRSGDQFFAAENPGANRLSISGKITYYLAPLTETEKSIGLADFGKSQDFKLSTGGQVDYIYIEGHQIAPEVREALGLSADASPSDVYLAIRNKQYSTTPIADANLSDDFSRKSLDAYAEALAQLDAMNCNIASTAYLLATADTESPNTIAGGFMNDGDNVLRVGEAHAWTFAPDGSIVDPTPSKLSPDEQVRRAQLASQESLNDLRNAAAEILLAIAAGWILRKNRDNFTRGIDFAHDKFDSIVGKFATRAAENLLEMPGAPTAYDFLEYQQFAQHPENYFAVTPTREKPPKPHDVYLTFSPEDFRDKALRLEILQRMRQAGLPQNSIRAARQIMHRIARDDFAPRT